MTTVLVTGATGFVGSHALEALARRPDVRVVAACRDPARLPPEFRGETRVGDLREPAYRAAVLAGIDTVCHCAAWTSLFGRGERGQDLYLEPSLALLNEAVSRGVGRFVHVSTTSAAVGANDPRGPGRAPRYWPHLANVVAIEEALRANATDRTAMVTLRFGIFAGRRYNLGLLPVLVPRLKTHLVPWVAGGRTALPITAGEDIGQAMALAATAPGLAGYEAFDIVGPEVPSVRQAVEFLHREYGLPAPHFSVPFPVAYGFAWLMEKLDPLVPWDPLVTRAIVHLMEETHADNGPAMARLGYRPQVHWTEAIGAQMAEMSARETRPMCLYRPIA